jgi:hypothetical protein
VRVLLGDGHRRRQRSKRDAGAARRHDIAGVVMSGTGGTRHHIGDVIVASELMEPGGMRAYHPNAALVALARRAATALPEPLERCTLVPPDSPTAEEVCLLFDPTVIFGGHLVSIDPFDGNAPPCSPGGGDVFGCELPPAGMLLSRTITTDDVEDMESAAVARIASRRRSVPGGPRRLRRWRRSARRSRLPGAVLRLLPAGGPQRGRRHARSWRSWDSWRTTPPPERRAGCWRAAAGSGGGATRPTGLGRAHSGLAQVPSPSSR